VLGVTKSHWHVLVYDDSAWGYDDGNGDDDNDELEVLVAMMLMMVLMMMMMMMMTLDGHKLVYLYYSFVVDALLQMR